MNRSVEMKLTVRRDDMKVTEMLEDFRNIVEVRSNGQHHQLPGHVLAEVKFGHQRGDQTDDEGFHIYLYHDQDHATRTGHVTLHVSIGEHLIIRRYCAAMQVDIRDTDAMADLWPTGVWDFLQTIVAIEKFLEKKEVMGYIPNLEKLIINGLARTPVSA